MLENFRSNLEVLRKNMYIKLKIYPCTKIFPQLGNLSERERERDRLHATILTAHRIFSAGAPWLPRLGGAPLHPSATSLGVLHHSHHAIVGVVAGAAVRDHVFLRHSVARLRLGD